ncbi:MAG: glycosyltransferase family 2 protein [Bacteroidetes bacterium]|nr:glycosyltransferase family 2 protein [Bacteroidota bacterium]
MTLSIIIVNYNVKFFLEQCLCSIERAIEKIDAEVFIVDNHSSDGSYPYLHERFPWAVFILNQENLGFSKANNQALLQAKGKYLLFLNPDTIVAEDCFEKCIGFMDGHPDAGALGVKMFNGQGQFLKESKRGFPSVWVSFCKLSGLTALFPHSKIFARYYLGHLNENGNQIIDVISGAFFFTRRDVLYKEGSFDERFFMYAEDIDLSYRIQKAGHTIYYLSETSIIHFKGESTKKDLRYVKIFYQAMSLFVQKHFGNTKNRFFALMIEPVIWLRAALSAFGNFFGRKEASKKENPRSCYLIGDPIETNQLGAIWKSKSRHLSNTEEAVDEILFCEGPLFSFKKLIDVLSQKEGSGTYLFHAKNSRSVVGSKAQISLDTL